MDSERSDTDKGYKNKGSTTSQALRDCALEWGGIEEEGVIPGRIWLVSNSLWGELHCNPLLSMQTWAGFH